MVTSDEKSLEHSTYWSQDNRASTLPEATVNRRQGKSGLEGINLVSNYTVRDDKEVAVNDVKSGMD